MAIDMRVLNYGPVGPKDLDADAASIAASEGGQARSATGSPAGIDALKDTTSSTSIDGATRVSGHTTGALNPTYISSAPDLPDSVGSRAPLGHAATLVSTTTAFQTSPSQPISAAEAFDLLQRAAQQGYELSSTFNRIANRANIDAKMSEAKHLMNQVEGEREHANTALVGAVAGAAIGAGIGIKGAGMMRSDAGAAMPKPPPARPVSSNATPVDSASTPTYSGIRPSTSTTAQADNASDATAAASSKIQQAHPEPIRARADSPVSQVSRHAPSSNQPGAAAGPNEPSASMQGRDIGGGIAQMGQPVSNVVTTAFDTYDKTSANGGQYQADQARIAQKNDTVASAIAQTTVDSSKSSLDQAQETIKAAQQLIQSYAERQAQVTNNIANR